VAIACQLQATPEFELITVEIAGFTRANFKAIDAETGEVTEFNAPGPRLTKEELERLEAILLQRLEEGDVVVVSGSLPQGVGPEVYAEWVSKIHKIGAKALLDTGGEALKKVLSAKPFLVKPNRLEAEELLGWPIRSREDALRAVRQIQTLGAQWVVLSLGAEGAVFAAQETLLALPPRVRVTSTVGCGDALLAGVVVGMFHRHSWQEIARYATALAAARACGEGVEFPNISQTQALLDEVRLEPLEMG